MNLCSVNQRPKSKKGTVQQDVVRFEELFAKLQRSKSLKKTNAMLHLLLQLSNDPKVLKSDEHVSGADGSSLPVQGGVIESVFASKLANQVAYKTA